MSVQSDNIAALEAKVLAPLKAELERKFLPDTRPPVEVNPEAKAQAQRGIDALPPSERAQAQSMMGLFSGMAGAANARAVKSAAREAEENKPLMEPRNFLPHLVDESLRYAGLSNGKYTTLDAPNKPANVRFSVDGQRADHVVIAVQNMRDVDMLRASDYFHVKPQRTEDGYAFSVPMERMREVVTEFGQRADKVTLKAHYHDKIEGKQLPMAEQPLAVALAPQEVKPYKAPAAPSPAQMEDALAQFKAAMTQQAGRAGAEVAVPVLKPLPPAPVVAPSAEVAASAAKTSENIAQQRERINAVRGNIQDQHSTNLTKALTELHAMAEAKQHGEAINPQKYQGARIMLNGAANAVAQTLVRQGATEPQLQTMNDAMKELNAQLDAGLGKTQGFSIPYNPAKSMVGAAAPVVPAPAVAAAAANTSSSTRQEALDKLVTSARTLNESPRKLDLGDEAASRQYMLDRKTATNALSYIVAITDNAKGEHLTQEQQKTMDQYRVAFSTSAQRLVDATKETKPELSGMIKSQLEQVQGALDAIAPKKGAALDVPAHQVAAKMAVAGWSSDVQQGEGASSMQFAKAASSTQVGVA